ncbi:inovirus Gp2 family protein [Pseudomonas aeruginosa]|uniref:YagK/YfjJ domain-containing protein n=1 Tax=Pseudomonas aeruginosa TaxID=287 RepID=UPI000F85D8F4|nr:inovirus-type Gp2 protein [Pseudomonas aeruginosa]RUJ45755.1 inovirus Gp2 family protein [Pseudomonas aeruginosa]
MNDTKDWIDCDGVSSLIVEEIGDVPLLRVEETLLLDLRRIERMMRCLEMSEEVELFSCSSGRNDVRVKATRLGSDFISNLLQGVSKFDYHFPVHEMNPYIEVFYRCINKLEDSSILSGWAGLINEDALSFVIQINSIICFARCEMSSKAFKKIKKRFLKASKKRSKSLEEYIDALFVEHSRMLVVRVDLSYRSDFFSKGDGFDDKLKLVKSHWAGMQRDLHKGKPVDSLLGFACKLEYGQLKGFHLHLLLFYNGSNHRQDGVLARMVGEHWRDSITTGAGAYFNCNAVKAKYRSLGIGMINFDQIEYIDVLKRRVASYLTKIDYWVRFSPEKGRAFFRGNMPKKSAVKRGRPRKVRAQRPFETGQRQNSSATHGLL